MPAYLSCVMDVRVLVSVRMFLLYVGLVEQLINNFHCLGTWSFYVIKIYLLIFFCGYKEQQLELALFRKKKDSIMEA